MSVNRNRGSEELSLKALSHAFIIKTKKTETFAIICGGIFNHHRKIESCSSDQISLYFRIRFRLFHIRVPNENSNTARLERVNSPSRCSDSRILTVVLPGGYSLLSGLVYGQTLSQINSAKKNPYCLTRELYRINDMVRKLWIFFQVLKCG